MGKVDESAASRIMSEALMLYLVSGSYSTVVRDWGCRKPVPGT